MPLDQMEPKDLHQGFLLIEEAMKKRHGEELWQYMAQGMQSAYYMGAIAALSSRSNPAAVFRQAENGLGEALRVPNLQIVGNQVSPPNRSRIVPGS